MRCYKERQMHCAFEGAINTCLMALLNDVDFYSAAALHAMQSAVIPTAIPTVCPSVRHNAGTLSRQIQMNIGLRDLHCEVAKTL